MQNDIKKHPKIQMNFGVVHSEYIFLSLRYINLFGATVNKIVGEVVNHAPVEILVHIAEAMTLRRQIEHIETLVGAD